MRSRLTLSLVLLLAVIMAGCAHRAQQNVRPLALTEFAAKFKANVGHDRRADGERIQALLPSCPVTSWKDIGTGAIVTYDYLHPSHKLSKQDLFRALGQPDSFYNHSYGDTVWYELVHETNNMVWELSVDLRDGYVVGSMISGSLK